MAHQLHYTSAAAGLDGRPGFQFVAVSPGADAAVRQMVAPHLTYRPPPSAPSRPAAAERAAFPVSYGFERTAAGLAVLVQCRYLGTDYSGRYGNFLGHAIVAEAPELRRRPIGYWGSPIWAEEPAPPGTVLPELAELLPGPAAGADAVLDLLAADRPRDGLLAELIDAAVASVERRAGRVLLVAERTETVAGWIAAVSFSVPRATAWDLSFVTYTADPDRAWHHLVGTTPDVLTGTEPDAQVFVLDRPRPAIARAAPGRFATQVAAAWRTGNPAAVKALCQAANAVTARRPAAGAGQGPARPLEVWAALVALARGEPLTPAETATVAAALPGVARRLPDWLWDGLASHRLDRVDLDLTLALYAAAGRVHRTDVADRAAGLCVALALPDRAARARLEPLRSAAGSTVARRATAEALATATDFDDLTEVVRIARRLGVDVPAAELRRGATRAVRARRGSLDAAFAAVTAAQDRAALLAGAVDGLGGADPARLDRLLTDQICDQLADQDWTHAPQVGALVLTSAGRRHPQRRVAATRALADLGARGLLPGVVVDRQVDRIWRSAAPTVAQCQQLLHDGGEQAVRPGSGVLRLARRALATADIDSEETVRLAAGLYELLGEEVGGRVPDVFVVVAAYHIGSGDLAAGCDLLNRAYAKGTRRLVRPVARRARTGFAAARPRQQAAILLRTVLSGRLRRELISSVARADLADADLAELAVRLSAGKRPERVLTARVAQIASRAGGAARLHEALLRRHRAYGAQLDQLLVQYEERRLLPRLRRPLRPR